MFMLNGLQQLVAQNYPCHKNLLQKHKHHKKIMFDWDFISDKQNVFEAWQEHTNIFSIKATEVGMLMKCPIP